MKKILVLLMVMAIAMGSMFAAEGSWTGTSVSDTASEAATLEVSLNLKDYAGTYAIGFTETAVEEKTGSDATGITITPTGTLTLTPDNDEYVGTVYGYYAIKSGTGVTLSFEMSADDKLTEQTKTSKTVDWTVTAADTPLTTSAQEVKSAEFTQGEYKIGSFPVSITTDGFISANTAANEVYTGTISLTVKTK